MVVFILALGVVLVALIGFAAWRAGRDSGIREASKGLEYESRRPKPFTHPGFPPRDLTHQLVMDRFATVEWLPALCPECGEATTEKKYDWWDIESSGQYMVYTAECPKGHGWSVSAA